MPEAPEGQAEANREYKQAPARTRGRHANHPNPEMRRTTPEEHPDEDKTGEGTTKLESAPPPRPETRMNRRTRQKRGVKGWTSLAPPLTTTAPTPATHARANLPVERHGRAPAHSPKWHTHA